MEKRWITQSAPHKEANRLARELNLHPLAAQILAQRGFTEPDQADVFLNPKLADLPHPRNMLGVAQAARRIVDGMERGESICIYGDYDVDGITSTALLVELFRAVGYPATFRLPSRLGEGYGFHGSAVEELAGEGVKLIVTVDCGISGNEACRRARELGVDVIITDHHEILGDLPDACAVINPHQSGCGFSDQPLAGVGIAFFLAGALRAELVDRGKIDPDRVDMKTFLDLVTLGTVADVAPIVGVNRILVSHGLKWISRGARPGIQALMEVARIEGKNILCGHISFQLAPRINAAGRLGDAGLGVSLLTGQDSTAVKRIAQELDQENIKRQQIEQDILALARNQLLNNPDYRQLYSIVLAGLDWHPGVVGIVASRIQEEFYRPSVLITFQGGLGRGSARSITGFNIFEALGACEEHLEEFGGHRYAAGLQIRPEKLSDFAAAFEREARRKLKTEELTPEMHIEVECDVDQVDARLVKDLAKLAPFGVGNPEPVFMTRDAHITFKRVVGGKHLKLRVSRKHDIITAMAFGMGERADQVGDRMDIAYTAQVNEYQGNTELQLNIRDLKTI